ncbi:ATP-binding protein [Mycobacteroides abscessus]|uniref:ATP-binding protein n=1 Tax=Mycobacteroides abscessus TaxID=36809 RepID=UPI000C256D4D|nr:ATP-binding protein [Mycobacteroides abscessus]MDM2496035.1 ATP-binding protein [Mycobacteroides abscessus]MDM2514606.1 ATP-binding protein [Mycobacteroides abscessus]MDM2523606.1 ATP-binding protein [Mycobacteroides abscessus]MDM2529767.1 ATP-binding protein [Mycobacteroides abscessus]MDM2531380.1 ATP-binding protein [Mycobacteroides abscessus]
MAQLEPVSLELLVTPTENPLDTLRIGLEDALKEYGEHDLLVELLQNALDASDFLRYQAICSAAGHDESDAMTVKLWNQAVEEAIKADCETFDAAQDAAARATWYGNARNDPARTRAWWDRLAIKMGGTAEQLAAAATSHRGSITIDVRTGDATWLTIEDNGVGIENVMNAFRLASSDKRQRPTMPRRHGVRGAHGWGLTAVLGLSDHVEVATRRSGQEQAYVFSDFASFARGDLPSPTVKPTAFHDIAGVDSALSTEGKSGTIVRVQLSDPSPNNILGYSLKNPTIDRLVNLLRMYTPIGQVNDYIAHPAFHGARKGDLDCTVRWTHDSTEPIESAVEYRYFELADLPSSPSLDFKAFVNGAMPSRRSVHTLYRGFRGGQYFLSAAEIQPADIVKELESDLDQAQALPGLLGDLGDVVAEIPRGFQVAVSGGMRTEYRAREPKSTAAAFRGIVLQENQTPTLGRRHVVDQRMSLPKVAADHERTYEDVRKKLVGKAEPQPQTLASATWRLEHIERIRNDLRNQKPLSQNTAIWAGKNSGEARVMLTFAELLALGAFGRVVLLECGLAHAYDFTFLQDTSGELDPEVQRKLVEAGYAKARKGTTSQYFRYGLGEFKDDGEKVLREFDENIKQKQADTIDLLVCYSFDEEDVTDQGWTSSIADESTREFIGQTHAWQPGPGYTLRQRALAVVSLETLVAGLIDAGKQNVFADPWPDVLAPVIGQ